MCELALNFTLKVTLLHGFFTSFLNCTNGTKSHKTPYTMWKSQFDSYNLHVLDPYKLTLSFLDCFPVEMIL